MQNLFVDASNYTSIQIPDVVPGRTIAFVDSVTILLSVKNTQVMLRLYLNIRDKTTSVIAY
jgi:hypothetical protein